MKILILNRRDIANPAGGGAEVYTHEIASGLVRRYNCECFVFSSRFPGSAAEEVIDGVKYMRKGNEATVHLWGLLFASKNRKKFDRIIDEFNGVGFFTFFLPNSILLIHQLYKEFWFTELGIKGALPYLLEPLLLRLYRKKKAITVSESTREDLDRMGFGKVKIVMNAIPRFPAAAVQKDTEPTIVFLGRLRKTKRPGDALRIFETVKTRLVQTRLWIIGAGPLETELRKLAEGLPGVTFWGWVKDEQKMLLLGRAHILLVPSVREGFGINVIEAASTGTPAVGYDVPGLRDSIQHGKTGYLTSSVDEAAARIVELLGDQAAYDRMSRNCLYYSKGFDWQKRVDEFWEIIRGIKK